MTRKIVIYTRFSSDLQSTKSCIDQEREVRDALSKMGIDHSDAVVIRDEAVSGLRILRDEFVRLKSMVDAGEIAILAVDDQSRLGRADNVFAFVQDLVYTSGRFISTGEAIDTNQQGWELKVKVLELHNSTTIQELGRRVRRGQLGRVLSDLSAGDLTYGYESYFLDPEKAASSHRGPKPEKGIRINETEARWVRWIFAEFNKGRSIAWIVRQLNEQKVPRGSRHKTRLWKRSHVRKILANAKYAGSWRWGSTRTLRNSQGKKKQIAVPDDQQVVAERPDLRIIESEVFDEAQEGLRKLKEVYGFKEGQKRRGPTGHYTEVCPEDLLAGLIRCSKCKARLWLMSSETRRYLGCPNHGHGEDGCPLSTRVPLKKAKRAVLDFLCSILTTWPEWIETSVTVMRHRIEEVSRRVPEEIANDERQIVRANARIDNLVEALADGTLQSQTVRARLNEAEEEAARLRKRLAEARCLLERPLDLPDNGWIQDQLNDLASVILEDEQRASILLRQIFGTIWADHVLPPGKSRGYSQLRFRINAWNALLAVLGDRISSDVLDLLVPEADVAQGHSDTFFIDLGAPSKMDQWAPKIAEMREKRVPWKEIIRITGLGSGPAYVAWKRYVDAQQSGEVDDDAEEREETDSLDSDSQRDVEDGHDTA